MRDFDFSYIEGFDWDKGNKTKNWKKHNVSCNEAEQVFRNQPLVIFFNKKHSESELRYGVFGKTDTNRRLTLSFTIRNKKIRIIMARNMSRKERKVYEQKKP